MVDLNQDAISALSDVALVRMLTVEAKEYTADVLAIAEAEANRRGVPIDEAFIPSEVEEPVKASEAERFEAAGESVACGHCGGELFERRNILMNTPGLTFLRLDWLNRSAAALICDRCGRIELFAKAPEAVGERE